MSKIINNKSGILSDIICAVGCKVKLIQNET